MEEVTRVSDQGQAGYCGFFWACCTTLLCSRALYFDPRA